MLKFTIEQLNALTDYQKLLIINFSLLTSFSTKRKVLNSYSENVDLLEKAEAKMDLNKEELDYLHRFFLENDLY